MGSSAFEEPVHEGDFVDGGIDPDGFIRAMARLARSTTDTESIHLLLSSIRIYQKDRRKSEAKDKFQSSNRKRRSKEDRKAGDKYDGNKRARRDVDRHVDNAKSAKGKRLVRIEAFECENCERFFATEAALKTHKDSCAQATNAPKSKKYKCDLCIKERTNIYNHYTTVHKIEYPEQIMFYGGNVLVLSDIDPLDPKGGKAPWFEKEEKKATKKYDNLTCRLCETETKFSNSEILTVHYTFYHMVEPSMLNNLKQLFRAVKGAHLVDLPTSLTPGKRKRATLNPTPDVLNPKYDKGKTRFPRVKYSTKGNLARHVKIAHLGKKPEKDVAKKLVLNENKKEKNISKPGDKCEPKSETVKATLRNVQSDSPIIEDSTGGPYQGNQQPIQILEDIPVVRVFCSECRTSITYSNFDAHAATHSNNQYSVDILSHNDCIEIEGNGGGTVETSNSDDFCQSLRISSHVVQDDVHVEREEMNQTNQDKLGCRSRSEENGNKDATDYATIEKTSEINADSTHQGEQNSEIHADATHQVQDTEEQEEWEVWPDLEKDLENLLGPEEIDTHLDKSAPDKNTNIQELQEILETDTTVQGTSEINNYREEHAVIQNKNNDSIIHIRNNAHGNISQDIFTSDSDPSEIDNGNSKICEISQDMFSGTTQENVNIVDIYKRNSNENAHIIPTTENDHGNAPNITLMENAGDPQPNPRPPTRDILCTLLEGTPSDVNAATEEERRNEEERKIYQQYLVDETQRIQEIMFSRDISQDTFTSDGDPDPSTSEIHNDNNNNGVCTTLTQTDYTHRHNQIANIIHQNLAYKHNLIQGIHIPCYKYTPLPVLENTTHKLYFDHAILTDRTIDYNRPDITLVDKVNKTTYLIDISVPNTRNIEKTITEKTTKYAELKVEVARIWRQEKVYVVPIIVSTTGFIPKHLLYSLKLLELKSDIYTILQKAAIFDL